MDDFQRVGIDKTDFFSHKYCSTVTPIPHQQYMDDMAMTTDKLVSQVQCDVPRSTVRINGVRIIDPDLLIRMLRASVSPVHVNTVLSLVTQTCLAHPVEAVMACLRPFQFVGERLGEERAGMVIDIRVDNWDKVTVHVEKPMAIVEIRGLQDRPQVKQHITLCVDFDSTMHQFILLYVVSCALGRLCLNDGR